MINNNLSLGFCTALYVGLATYKILDIILPTITIDIKINRNFFSLVGGVVTGLGIIKFYK